MFKLRKTLLGEKTFKAYEPSGAWDGGTASVPAGLATGLVSGTRVATSFGWRSVEAIVEGDMVLTFDDGMQEVVRVERGYLWTAASAVPSHLWPLEIPEGALGNQRAMQLLPEQSVMVESDSAEHLFGDPFTLIPAAALDGYKGITRVAPMAPVEVITLHFSKDQVVFANVGALFFCPAHSEGAIAPIWGEEAEEPLYHTLPLDDAELLVDCLMSEAAEIADWAAAGAELRASAA
ncbi:MAG: hypothetical protein ACJA2X_002286 [Halocynthiibacter sp.]|jgi:hypothetical protein